MRIALLTDGIAPYVIGGMQKHSFYLAKYFAINKIYVDLYFTSPNMPNELDCFEQSELHFINPIYIPYPEIKKYPGHYIREQYEYSSRILVQFKKNSNVDYIYIQGFSGMKLLENKKDIHVPIGINFHGLEMFQKSANLKSKLQQLLFKRPVLKCIKHADFVFSLGGQLTGLIKSRGIKEDKIIQIPIGINEDWLRINPIVNNKPIRFLFIGRYERRKGVEELNLVIKKINRVADFNFEFIGPIPAEKQIKAENIIYHGALNDTTKIKEIVLRADVLVCPSYSEGMPTVILEGMSCGLAIIASDVGAVSEMVGVDNGILIKPGSIDELKGALEKMIKMPDNQLIFMKNNSIKKIRQKFLWNNIIEQILNHIIKSNEKI